MNAYHSHTRRRRTGIAWVLAILCLMLLSTLATALLTQANVGVRISANHGHVARALLAAESGLSFMLHQLDTLYLSHDTTPDTFVSNLRAALDRRFSRTDLLSGSAVEVVGEAVVVPEIVCSDGAFQCSFTWIGSDRARLTVRGRYGEVYRRVSLELMLLRRLSLAFDYGVASKGQVVIWGNSRIL
ncbi:MAG: hypothetical protein KAX80_12045, partial [Planctomycetes bacterium]|nr:hypothetical protein [Planctomycetota bacterium]